MPKSAENSLKRRSPNKKNFNQIDATATKSDDEESVNYISGYQQLYKQVYVSNCDSDSDYYVAAISSDAAQQLEPLNAKIQYGKFITNSMFDSGSVCSIITKTLANNILKTPSARWIASTCEKYLPNIFKRNDQGTKKIATTLVYNDWISENACLTVVEDGPKLIIEGIITVVWARQWFNNKQKG